MPQRRIVAAGTGPRNARSSSSRRKISSHSLSLAPTVEAHGEEIEDEQGEEKEEDDEEEGDKLAVAAAAVAGDEEEDEGEITSLTAAAAATAADAVASPPAGPTPGAIARARELHVAILSLEERVAQAAGEEEYEEAE
eukprot:evm.model.NODE_24346_length_1185_cov_16.295359.1